MRRTEVVTGVSSSLKVENHKPKPSCELHSTGDPQEDTQRHSCPACFLRVYHLSISEDDDEEKDLWLGHHLLEHAGTSASHLEYKQRRDKQELKKSPKFVGVCASSR